MQARDSLSDQVLPCDWIFSLSFRDQNDHHERSGADEPLTVLRVISVVVLEFDDGRRVDGLAILWIVFLDNLRPRGLLSNDQLDATAGHHSSRTVLVVEELCCGRSLGLEGTRAVVLPWEALRFCEPSKVRGAEGNDKMAGPSG